MIPRNIKREHIIKAIEEIERRGIPVGRTSKKFLLKYNKKIYPPKFVISLAKMDANGKKLSPNEFSGGMETNNFLQNLGFDIEKITENGKFIRVDPLIKEKKLPPEGKHSERCPKCKETIKNLLQKVYGEVQKSPKFEIGTLPEDFKKTPYYENLKVIYESLQKYRGASEFVKTRRLPPSELFVKDPKFIFEYDESQHFTEPRRITLEYYPEDLRPGFDRKRWIELCKKINSKDKGIDIIIGVVEVKSEDDDDESTPAKQRYAEEHFHILNEKILEGNKFPPEIFSEKENHINHLYIFDLLIPPQFDHWFQNLRKGQDKRYELQEA